jgi:phosphate uptake regulator
MTTERWTDEMLDKLAETVKENADAIRDLRQETKEQGIRFFAYQQASQWVVNLAFGLLATATITTIVSAVVRR